MRVLSVAAFVIFIAAQALASSADTPVSTADFRERLNGCSAQWSSVPSDERGSVTYRQFTTKCLQGKTAKPADAVAECRNGITASGMAPEGPCAFDGGIERWVN